MSWYFQEKRAGATKTLKNLDFHWLAQSPRATESTVKSWLQREGWKDGFGLGGGSQGFSPASITFLLMECPIFPRVAHVGFWLLSKPVSCSSWSLQTATGTKTLGKAVKFQEFCLQNLRNKNFIAINNFISLLQPLRSLLSLNLLNFFLF